MVGIAAVVQAPSEETRLVPHPPMGVLMRLGPNTVSQIAGWDRETLAVCHAGGVARADLRIPSRRARVGRSGAGRPPPAGRMSNRARVAVPVTVVIPARDAAATIASTLDSVLGQTAGTPQVIVIDDGSSDDTAALAKAAGPTVILVEAAGRGRSGAEPRGRLRGDTLPVVLRCGRQMAAGSTGARPRESAC